MKIQFFLRFHTQYGQSLHVFGNTDILGNNNPEHAFALSYFNEEYWHGVIDAKDTPSIHYNYLLKNNDGEIVLEHMNSREIIIAGNYTDEVVVYDIWNHTGEFENVFFTQPFKDVLLKKGKHKMKKMSEEYSHIFKIKAPLLRKNEIPCITGSAKVLGEWNAEKVVCLQKDGDWWVTPLNLFGEDFPVSYKYGIYNDKKESFSAYEDGNNRVLYEPAGGSKKIILHDGFIQLPNNTWRGGGVSIPVFSLRSKNSFGVGEFTDIKLMVDWANEAGLKMIQILPVNDTTAYHTWMDSYPYSGISAFALHPMFVNLEKIAGKEFADVYKAWKIKQRQLNALPDLDYEAVMNFKSKALRELYDLKKTTFKDEEGYKQFFEENKYWLEPYSAFCYLRDKNGTSNFEQWKTNSIYNKEAIQKLTAPNQRHHNNIAIHYFIQYHLHLQLKEAVAYAHKQGVILKGDIPIGINRYGCDAWMAPEICNLSEQAGAPPDDFAVKGQNWGFPTYNWKRMAEDGFEWWKKRFTQMGNYFDAFRIDHILGFFRIWSIPAHAIDGIMGRFVPAIPVHINEFAQNGIWFDHYRYCHPFITENLLEQEYTNISSTIRDFLNSIGNGFYELKPEYNTQRKVEAFFNTIEATDERNQIKEALMELIANVILFEEEDSNGEKFHFRIAMDSTSSYRNLDGDTQQKLKNLYVNYFFRRQDDFWKKEAMNKLPALKRSTNMLICGEDLGMVPECVPDVMKQLGILSLEIQRMPKDPKKEFFHPNDAPYLSVVTPSTHDMSTIRGWWEEDRERTQKFFNQVMGQWGEAPFYCEAWINKSIILQHLYSPAMWCVFQLQDILGMSEKLRRENPHDERINIPANPKHYWRYRMHIPIEQLIKAKEFNEELHNYIKESGR